MSLALTIIAGSIIAMLGLIGLWRDVQRGFLSLVGTLLGVVLVQVWGGTWSLWLQDRLGFTPSTSAWVASSLSFLFVALFVGYGSGLRVAIPNPSPDPKTKSRGRVLARPAGALLGMLNGALIASVLLFYARDWSANETVQAAITESFVLTLLIDWFPWFILGVALVLGAQAIGRWTMGGLTMLGRMSAARQKPAATQPKTPTQPKTVDPQAQPPVNVPKPATSPAVTPQLTPEQQRIADKNEADHNAALRRTAEKISQRIGE